MKYKFIFGNAPELAQAELKAVGTDLPPQELIKRLGGTVKIAEILPEDIQLSEIIKNDFGISDLTGKIDITRLCKDIKNETGQRFVLPKHGERQLSSVVVAKQKLTEIIIGDGWVGKTVVVQDFEEWGRRDYGRPAPEGHLGMLPPKVARMMINIGSRGQALGSRILDPFCGVGTILSEGLICGAKIIGSDINEKQIDRTRKNLEWLSRTYNLEPSHYQLYVSDARTISGKVQNIDAIVTEPDLGPGPNLDDLYIAALADWKKVLVPGGRVVIAFPSVKNILDKAKSIGYSLVEGPYKYARPQAKIIRNICILKYGSY